MINNEILIEQLKESITLNSAEIISACDDVLMCRAAEQTIKEITEEIQTKILMKNCYMIAEEYKARHRKSERITRPFDSYLMTDDDFHDYIEKCYIEYVKADIAHQKGKGYCPDAPFTENRIKAENRLLELFEKIIPDIITHEEYKNMCMHWKFREKLLDLALDMKRLEGVKYVERAKKHFNVKPEKKEGISYAKKD